MSLSIGLESSEMMSLEDEISHLQKENYRIEAQLGRMKGEIPGLLIGEGQDKVGSA